MVPDMPQIVLENVTLKCINKLTIIPLIPLGP